MEGTPPQLVPLWGDHSTFGGMVGDGGGMIPLWGDDSGNDGGMVPPAGAMMRDGGRRDDPGNDGEMVPPRRDDAGWWRDGSTWAG